MTRQASGAPESLLFAILLCYWLLAAGWEGEQGTREADEQRIPASVFKLSSHLLGVAHPEP